MAGDTCAECNTSMKTIRQDKKSRIGLRRTLSYGSQIDTVQWQTAKIMLKGWKLTCDPNDSDAISTHLDNPSSSPVCVVGISDVAVTVARSGTSSYNILGLGRQTTNGPPSFLSTMYPDPPRAFAIYLHSM